MLYTHNNYITILRRTFILFIKNACIHETDSKQLQE